MPRRATSRRATFRRATSRRASRKSSHAHRRYRGGVDEYISAVDGRLDEIVDLEKIQQYLAVRVRIVLDQPDKTFAYRLGEACEIMEPQSLSNFMREDHNHRQLRNEINDEKIYSLLKSNPGAAWGMIVEQIKGRGALESLFEGLLHKKLGLVTTDFGTAEA